mmetsp:Transcript_22940/g.69078  ORF Transcript_22940/g.69078 Transcript_22940/m.69078 type:complete len:92 (-) Transcript_22940:469-744(-)
MRAQPSGSLTVRSIIKIIESSSPHTLIGSLRVPGAGAAAAAPSPLEGDTTGCRCLLEGLVELGLGDVDAEGDGASVAVGPTEGLLRKVAHL